MKILMQVFCRKHNWLWFLHSRSDFTLQSLLRLCEQTPACEARAHFTRRGKRLNM